MIKKWHFHGDSHTFHCFVRELKHHHLPQQKAHQHASRARWRPAGRASAQRPAPRGPTAGTGHPRQRRGCPSRTASRRCLRSRGAVPSIGLEAGARIVQAPGLPPAPAPDGCAAALESAAGPAPIFLKSGSAAQRPGASARPRAHIPVTPLNSRGGRQRPAHAAEPPGPLHLPGHFGQLPRARISWPPSELEHIS